MGPVWTNPKNVRLSDGFLYFIRVVDDDGNEYRYIGKTARGEKRLHEYRLNIEKIFAGRPRRSTPGQEKFRAVHFALAKAVELGWEYDFYPLENVDAEGMNNLEKSRIAELSCVLNVGRSWDVGAYSSLRINDLVDRLPVVSDHPLGHNTKATSGL